MNNLKRLLVAGTAICLPALVVAPARAQGAQEQASQGDGGLADIVVTAQRRQERLQDVPISVTALDAGTIERQQIQNTENLARIVPNLQGSNGTGFGTGNAYSLRGLFNTESLATFESPVATYIDGIYQGRLGASNVSMFDVERVEVLRGPQGTLFGKNTTGGAINVTLAQPEFTWGGMAEIGYGSYDRFIARGAVTGPLADGAAFRLSAFHVQDHGYVRNLTTGGRNNDENSSGVRAAVTVDAIPGVRWNLSAIYLDLSKAFISHTIEDGARVSRSGLERLGALVPSRKGQLEPNSNSIRNIMLISDINIETGLGNLQFLTGYTDLDQDYLIDFFNSPFPTGGFDYANINSSQQFSQEIKLNGSISQRLRYIAGLFYLRERNVTDFADLLNTTGTPRVTADRLLRNNTNSYAIYAQFDYDLAEGLALTAGLRWTREEKALSLMPNPNPLWATPFGDTQLRAAGIPLNLETSQLTPRFAVQYRPATDVMLFASATRGFKSGGWNGRATTPSAFRAFSPETVWSYEGGVRSEWFDRHLRANLTVFQTEVADLQIPTAFTPPAGAITYITQNFADFRSRGVELELALAPVRGLNLAANFGLLDTEFTRLDPSVETQLAACRAQLQDGGATPSCGQGIVRADGTLAPPARAPGHTASLSADYSIPIGARLQLIPSANVAFIGRYNVSTSGLAVADVPAYTVVNLGISLGTIAPGWQVALDCTNCTNETYLTSAISNRLYYNEPRRVNVRLRLGF